MPTMAFRMQKHNLDHLIECSRSEFNSRVLIGEPEFRLVLIGMQPSQSIPERALLGTVAMYVIRGSISVSVGSVSYDIHAGELCTIEDGIVYQIEANEHSALLVMSTEIARVPVDEIEELDVNELPYVEPNRVIASIDLPDK